MTRAVLLASALVFAHGDLHEQIEWTSRAITKDPSNANLYLRRGELHRLHLDWREAFDDYARAEKLDHEIAEVELGRGRAFAGQGLWREAEAALTRYLIRVPNAGAAFALRADVLDKQGKPSARDWSAAISNATEPRVEYFIGLAESHARQGQHRESLEAIDSGIAKLGSLVTLRQWAVESLARQRKWSEALRRLEPLIEEAVRKETWLTRKAEIERDASRWNDARQTARQAQAAIGRLPPNIRQTKAMLDLAARLQQVANARPPVGQSVN